MNTDLNEHILINIYSHHFTVKTNHPHYRKVVISYARNWMRYQMFKNPRTGNIDKVFVCTYAGATKSRSEIRYHINQYPSFEEHLVACNIPRNKVIFNQHPYTRNNDLMDIELLPGWEPRDEQPEVIKYSLLDDYHTKMLTIQTGQGKSATSLFVNQIKRERFCLVTRPSYLEKWIIDIEKMYKVNKDEIVMIKGRDSLIKLIEIAKAGLISQYKAVLISNRTFLSFIEDYEEHEEDCREIWGCLPHELWSLLKIDTLYMDEGHQDTRIMFKVMLYTHIEKLVVMSATFDPDESFLKRVTEVMYPKVRRYEAKLSNKHTLAYCLKYHFAEPSRIRCMSRGNYSHLAFEKSIIKNKRIESNYYRMIASLLEGNYFTDKKEGFKAIIFCHTVKMCTRLRDYLQRHDEVKKRNLKVGRYVQEDNYDTLLNSDIVITTIKSAGTAVDIPNLYVGIMTVALRSSQTNVQVLGRLRRMKDGTNPKFIWLSNKDNMKHRRYDQEKFILFKNRTKSIGEFHYQDLI